jgi:predicted TIM-barrel fold metal-dependent hydrolase
MKKISIEEAYISPYFSTYCKLDSLIEYDILTGRNNHNYNYLLDPNNIRFKEADAKNITFIISATVPGSQNLKKATDAPIFCRKTNDYFRDKVNTYNKINNTYHSFFAVIPFNNVESAINELERVNNFDPPINRVLFNGPTVNNDKYEWLISKEWIKFWEYANKKKTVFYIHPFIAESYSDFLPDVHFKNYNQNYPQLIGSQIGFHLNTAIFILKLYINNIFDNYPNIQWITGHMGETLIWYLWRFDHRTKIYFNEIKKLKKLKKLTKEEENNLMKFPKKTLTQLFTSSTKKHAQIMITTSGWFNTQALYFAINTVGINNIMFALDTPYEDLNTGLNWLNNLKLPKDAKEKLAWKNANDIFKILPSINYNIPKDLIYCSRKK